MKHVMSSLGSIDTDTEGQRKQELTTSTHSSSHACAIH